MKVVKHLVALMTGAAVIVAAVPAGATPVINTYQAISRFSTAGSIGTVIQQFTLAFDPSVNSSGSVLNYSTSTSDPSFNPVGGVGYSVGTPANQFAGSSVSVGGTINGFGVPNAGTFDFRTLFFVTPTTGAITSGGQLIPFNADSEYSNAGSTVFDTFDVTVSLIASSVPEANVWAMMILGFGVVGGLARGRRRSPVLAFRSGNQAGTGPVG